MRKLPFSLALVGLALWAPPTFSQVGPPNTIQCNAFAPFTGTAGAAIVITGNVAKTIAICGWHVTSTSSTTTTFQITAGTGAACGTGTITVTPALNVTITAPSADHIDYASLSYAGPNNICVNAPASVTGGIWYSQF